MRPARSGTWNATYGRALTTATAPTIDAASSAPPAPTRSWRSPALRRESHRSSPDGTSRRRRDRPRRPSRSTSPPRAPAPAAPPFISMMTRAPGCLASTSSSRGTPMPWPRNGMRAVGLEAKAGVDARELRRRSGALTGPVRSVVRSSVGSWMTTGMPSDDSCTSISRPSAPSAMPLSNAGIVFSGASLRAAAVGEDERARETKTVAGRRTGTHNVNCAGDRADRIRRNSQARAES